ncbi:MAG: hypothetical protein ACTSPU_09500 [Promethearchaeota archaeon]
MVLFQPPSGPANPWDVGEYRWAELLIWIVAIIGIIWGVLLLFEYINKRKRHHLVWAASFSLVWIGFHQVISTGTFATLLDPFLSAILAFIPGLLAAGLLMSVFSEKKLLGELYALFALLVAIGIGMAKFDPFMVLDDLPLFGTSMVMLLHIPSGLILIILPLYTTIKKETRWPALFMTIGGILFSLVGALIAIATTGILDAIALETGVPADWALFVLFGLFPIFLVFAYLAFALGTLIPAKWNFDIPGVEFEERA